MFSLGSNCAILLNQSGNFIIRFEQGSGVCRDLRPSDFASTDVQSTCVYIPVVLLCHPGVSNQYVMSHILARR